MQSSYQYKTRRRPATPDDDTDAKTSSLKQSENSTVQDRKSSQPHTPTNNNNNNSNTNNKLASDAFFGSVTGRLAQEIHDEFLVCKICFESYNNPKCLSCLHTFCAGCIERHISAEVTYNKYTDYRDFTCPLCRKRTQLPLGGVKRLPDNFLISGLTDLVTRQRASSVSSSSATLMNGRGPGDGLETAASSVNGDEDTDHVNQLPKFRGRRGITYGECEICAQVGCMDRGHSTEPTSKNTLQVNETGRASSANLSSTPQASAKCLDCNKLLCTDCVQRHRNTRVTKDHATFDLQSGNEIECKEHPGESVRFYCEVCSSCVCVLCTFNEHREHEVTSFGEAVATMRTELSAGLDQAADRIVHCRERLRVVVDVASLVTNLERQIKETAEQFIEAIRRQEQDVLHDLRQFIGSRTMHVIDQHVDQEHQLNVASEICTEAAKYIDGQDIDMLLAKPDLYAKMEQLNALHLDDTDFEPISPELYFHPGTVQLGYLTNDLSGPPTEHYDYIHMPLSSSQSSVELANRPCVNTSASQTDPAWLESVRPTPTEARTERQFRSRACSTDSVTTMDQETNTRPRGINTIITFEDSLSNANSEEFLAQLDANQLDLQSMDNLTRARMRRKLREHRNTIDSTTNVVGEALKAERTRNGRTANEHLWRRYSAMDKPFR